MKELYNSLKDYEKMYIEQNDLEKRIKSNEIIKLRGADKIVLVGNGLELKINSSIGLNDKRDFIVESHKINSIKKHKNKPDIMMDLSTVEISAPLYEEIKKEIGCPVGTIPYYTCFDTLTGIDVMKLLEHIEEQAERGVSFMTLHLTADLALAKEAALNRNIPIISRGGSILLRDMQINKRKRNILLENLDQIISILRKYNVVVSIGTTYRPSTHHDALDYVQKKEIEMQFQISKYLNDNGIETMMEGIGHISFCKIPEYVSLLRENNYIPFMPLGPMVSDYTFGQDHITSSIGATYIASLGGADIINSVTREEHTGGIPAIETILEAIDSAKTVVQIVNESKYSKYYNQKKNNYKNCIGKTDQLGCYRCKDECPFIWNEETKEIAIKYTE